MKRPALVIAIVSAAVATVVAQDRLRQMPGYEQFQKMQTELPGAVVSGALQGVQWEQDGRSVR